MHLVHLQDPELNDSIRHVENPDWDAIDRKCEALRRNSKNLVTDSASQDAEAGGSSSENAGIIDLWSRSCVSWEVVSASSSDTTAWPEIVSVEEIDTYMRPYLLDISDPILLQQREGRALFVKNSVKGARKFFRNWDDYIAGAALAINPFPVNNSTDTSMSDYAALAEDYHQVAVDLGAAWASLVESEPDVVRAVEIGNEGRLNNVGDGRRGRSGEE